jgi:hAT family protein
VICARKYLSAPTGTAISEREFKVASDITGGERIRLLPENAEKLLFLKYNLRLIGYRSNALPCLDGIVEQTSDQRQSHTDETAVNAADSDDGLID